MKKEAVQVGRCETGISGFDKLCEGGFVQGSLNLVVGSAGAGKTTFMLQFLHNGASKFNENGLYVSLEQELAEIHRSAKKQGMDFEGLEKSGKVSFLKLSPDLSAKEIYSKIKSYVEKRKVKRVCFDPLNMIALEIPGSKKMSTRREIYELMTSMNLLGATIVVSGEAEDEGLDGQTLASEITFAKYIADGVVELYSSGLGGMGDRALRISKMRMTNHSHGPIPMKLCDSGMDVVGR